MLLPINMGVSCFSHLNSSIFYLEPLSKFFFTSKHILSLIIIEISTLTDHFTLLCSCLPPLRTFHFALLLCAPLTSLRSHLLCGDACV
jgi:hypothetical protein